LPLWTFKEFKRARALSEELFMFKILSLLSFRKLIWDWSPLIEFPFLIALIGLCGV
jgi:hypothetical protein